MILYISFMYSSGMPVLYFLGAIWYTITFFIDKCLYLRLYRKLPHFDRMVHSRIRSFFDYAIFLHMGIGFWMYSSTEIFFTVKISLNAKNVMFRTAHRTSSSVISLSSMTLRDSQVHIRSS